MKYFLLLPYVLLFALACTEPTVQSVKTGPQWTLGQWSFHTALFEKEMTTFDFIKEAKELGFDGVDLVNQFFIDKANDAAFLDSIKMSLEENDLIASILLIDLEGELASNIDSVRLEAVENHKKWIRMAGYINCPVMRVNLHGSGTPEEMMMASEQSLSSLAKLANSFGVQIVAENHGGISGDGIWLSTLLSKVESMNVACLADFDNWCVEREGGKLWGALCINQYDPLKGMDEILPYASGVSVKAFEFDSLGNERNMNYPKLFDLLKKHEFDGFYGVEYEGSGLSPKEGILKTFELGKRSLLAAKAKTENK